jgi:ParB/RepB/Spo0J family partition protein
MIRQTREHLYARPGRASRPLVTPEPEGGTALTSRPTRGPETGETVEAAIAATTKKKQPGAAPSRVRLQHVPVARIRPEEGLGRRRDRDGHRELCRSIEQFGVLTPITVRRARDGTQDYLLIKGQGRALACRLLGIEKIPALIVDDRLAETEKVQQFLVENVARLRFGASDRALLIAHARRRGEETAEVAKRFGVSPATVRRLDAQLDGASSGEVAALRAGDLNLTLHAVIAKHVPAAERSEVIRCITRHGIRAREMETLFSALGWRSLTGLGPAYSGQRLALLEWASRTLACLPRSDPRERLRQLALRMPLRLPPSVASTAEAL